MALYGMRQLIDGFLVVHASAIQIAEDIPAERYDFRPTPESRSVGETLTHITWLLGFTQRLHGEARLPSLEGFDFLGVVAESRGEEMKTRAKSEIVALLHGEGERFAAWLEELPEQIVTERVAMPGGGSATRFEMLLECREHVMHHRAQLTVLERLVGVVPHSTRAMMAMSEEPAVSV